MMKKSRLSYRKSMKMQGSLLIGGSAISFFTKNVSLKGLHACCTEANGLEVGDMVYVCLPLMKMEGVASIIWKKLERDGICHIGLKFLKMRGIGGSAYHYRYEGRILSR